MLLNSVMSDSMDVIMGVPQGSILGPLLFMIFINKLTRQCSECCVHPYADDTILGGRAHLFRSQKATDYGKCGFQQSVAGREMSQEWIQAQTGSRPTQAFRE